MHSFFTFIHLRNGSLGIYSMEGDKMIETTIKATLALSKITN
jgi:hypothetical protein